MTSASTITAGTDATPRKGGVVTWACAPGFPPAVIFPFTPAERMGTRNILEFQALMYRTLYYFGSDGTPNVDYAQSIGEEPVWSEDGLTVRVKVKPWKWSNGETLSAENVLFWVNLMKVKGARYGEYVPGYFPDNLTDYGKVADDEVFFTFDKVYSKHWVLYNQLSTITPLPRAWDRTDAGPANASGDLADVEAVYEYLMAQQGNIVDEGNAHRTKWADSPIWSIVSGPWRLKSYTLEGVVTFVPNEHYSGPNKPYLDEFRQVPTFSDEEQYEMLKAGPDAENGIQVGYLPLSFATEPAIDPVVGGPNPLTEYTMFPQSAFCIRYISLNFNNPTVVGKMFAQTYIRQALQSSLDQDTAVRDIYQGYAYRQNGPVPMYPKTDYVSPRQREGAWPLPFSPGNAKALLEANGWDTSVTPAVCVRPGTGPGEAGAGIPAGTKLSILLRYVEGRPALTRVMENFRDAAAEAGIELRLEEVYGSILVAEDGPCEPTATTPCTWEMCCWNGGWAYHHPTGEILFSTKAGGNFGFYTDPKADELIERTVTSDDLDVLYEYQDYIANEVPVIFTPNFPIRLFEVANTLGGFGPINPYGMINPENWYYRD
ncbi:ABC transporter substrate-binding protein [Saccharothrix sp. 6-C]|uniref:Peptide/nickel transport system substrate-binding protein n=1 Tax=Saccharothrix texasensis TaxID=103734 RepID=A0A3N1H266_9PSEU|nr:MULTISPECIES: ABC transporter substrate-binding protein [Saccharothrix]QQQ78683.1 ABC transporter substrate-binding protein [Saccharothrix sp. 6-C]ROP36624.1 peptide/nickel transport system substrate-binding protein [Saccharothrix texasensis]